MFDLLPRVLGLESRPGSMRLMSGLSEGKEAQAMATLISMPDQMPAFTPSKVVSVETDIS